MPARHSAGRSVSRSARRDRFSSAPSSSSPAALLLSGASLGAILRRSGHTLHRAATKARASNDGIRFRDESATTTRMPVAHTPPVDAAAAFPDVVDEKPALTLAPPPFLQSEPAPLVVEEPTALRRGHLGERGLHAARRRRPHAVARADRRLRPRDDGARRRASRPDARALRDRGDRHRPDLRPARHALRAAARAGDEGRQGRGTQGRSLVRARDDRDPHPRADPRQAGRRRRAAEPLAEPRHARRHLRAAAADRESRLGLAREGHLRRSGLDGSRADAAPPHRRHDRLR